MDGVLSRLLPTAACLLSACSAGGPSRVGEAAADATEVRAFIDETNDHLERWYAAGLIDSGALVFTEDARQMGPSAELLVGREAILEFWRRAVQWGSWNFSLEAEDVSISGPLAVERGAYTVRFVPGPMAPAGMGAFSDTGNYLVEWQRRDGQWRIRNDLATTQLPRTR